MNGVLRSTVLIALAGALVCGTAAQAAVKSAATGPGAPATASGMPCAATIARAMGGKQLRFGLVCTSAQVVIARFDFPRSVKLVGQQPFSGGYCSGRGTNIWYCVFTAGVPSGTPLTGALLLKKRSAVGPQSVRATYFTSSTIGTESLDLDPGWTQTLRY